MEIVIGRMDGKMPGAWEIIVRGDSAVHEHYKLGNKITEKVALTNGELDRIAQVIQQTRPDLIRMKHHHQVIADKATSYIRLKHGQYSVSLSEGASTKIKGKAGKDFIYLFNTVRDIAMAKHVK